MRVKELQGLRRILTIFFSFLCQIIYKRRQTSSKRWSKVNMNFKRFFFSSVILKCERDGLLKMPINIHKYVV